MYHPLPSVRRGIGIVVAGRRFVLPRLQRSRHRLGAVSGALGLVAGTPFTWTDTTGTYALTLNALASGSASGTTGIRQGVKSATLVQAPPGLTTATMPWVLEVELNVTMASAATAGGQVQQYIAWSGSATAGTDNDGGTAVTGTDAAGPDYTALGGQVGFVGSVVLTVATTTQIKKFTVAPLDAYMCPVVYNGGSVTLKATNNVNIITVTPWYLESST